MSNDNVLWDYFKLLCEHAANVWQPVDKITVRATTLWEIADTNAPHPIEGLFTNDEEDDLWMLRTKDPTIDKKLARASRHQDVKVTYDPNHPTDYKKYRVVAGLPTVFHHRDKAETVLLVNRIPRQLFDKAFEYATKYTEWVEDSQGPSPEEQPNQQAHDTYFIESAKRMSEEGQTEFFEVLLEEERRNDAVQERYESKWTYIKQQLRPHHSLVSFPTTKLLEVAVNQPPHPLRWRHHSTLNEYTTTKCPFTTWYNEDEHFQKHFLEQIQDLDREPNSLFFDTCDLEYDEYIREQHEIWVTYDPTTLQPTRVINGLARLLSTDASSIVVMAIRQSLFEEQSAVVPTPVLPPIRQRQRDTLAFLYHVMQHSVVEALSPTQLATLWNMASESMMHPMRSRGGTCYEYNNKIFGELYANDATFQDVFHQVVGDIGDRAHNERTQDFFVSIGGPDYPVYLDDMRKLIVTSDGEVVNGIPVLHYAFESQLGVRYIQVDARKYELARRCAERYAERNDLTMLQVAREVGLVAADQHKKDQAMTDTS